MTAARNLQEAFDWTPGADLAHRDVKPAKRRTSKLAEEAGRWLGRAAELGLSEAQALVLYKADAGKALTNVGGRWRWAGGKPFALTSTVRALAKRELLEPPWKVSARRDAAGRPTALGWSRPDPDEKPTSYRLTRLGLQAAMYVRGEGVARPEVPR